MKSIIRSIKREEEIETKFSDLGIWDKIDTVIYAPFKFIILTTIPPCDEENFNNKLCMITPFPMIILLFYIFEFHTDSILFTYVAMPIALVLQFIFYYTLKDLKEGELPKYFIIISIFSALVGLFWTYFTINIIVDVLDTFVIFCNLDYTFMGITVLGIGNAIPDAFATVAIARVCLS